MIGYQTYTPTQAQQHTLIQRVCFLLASGLLISALGSWATQGLPPEMLNAMWLPTMLLMFGLIFVMKAVARKPGVNVFVFYLFCLVEGAWLGPLLALYATAFGPSLVAEAFLLTAVTVAGVGGYAYTSGKDFGFLGKGLMWALVGLILFGFAWMFVYTLHTPVVMLGYDIIGVAIFVGFLLYDFSKIRLRYSPEDYTMAAVNVYLDFVNLFLFILNILAMLQGGGSSSRRR
jgi:FtsH-binding integral membrane protein